MTTDSDFNPFLNASVILNKALVKAPNPIVLFEGIEFKITFANEATLLLWQKDDSIIGKTLTDIFKTTENPRLFKSLKKVFESGNPYTDKAAATPHKNAHKIHYYDYIYSAIRDSQDIIRGVLLIATDVTDHYYKAPFENVNIIPDSLITPSEVVVNTKADDRQDLLETQQAILASIVETSDDTILSKTLGGIITSWNKAAERMFGYKAEEAIGKHISILIPPSRLSEEDVILKNIIQGNKIDHFETIRISKDGTEIPVSLSVSPIKNKNGKIIGASKIARDITESQKDKERQAVLAAIVDNSDDTILSKTLEGIITSWNKSAQRMFGYTEEEIIGKHVSILIPPFLLNEEESILSSIINGIKIEHFETTRLTKSGKEIPVSLSVSPIKDSYGKIIGASKTARDISIRKLAKAAAERYTASLEIMNSMGKAISEELDIDKILQKVTDETTHLTGARLGAFFYNTVDANGESSMLYALCGASKKDFESLGMPQHSSVFDITFNGRVLRVDDITQDARYGKNTPYFGLPKGHLPVTSFLSVPVISKSGEIIGGLFFGHPEAGKFNKDHESMVLAIASQASIGLDNAKLYGEIKELNSKKDEFIGLASHELKTPLTSISGYLQILAKTQTDERNKRFIKKTIHQVNKLAMLVSDLLDVSKIEAGKLQLSKTNFDIKEVLDDAIELIEHSNYNCKIDFKANIDALMAYGDAQRIEQVIINLLTNAIKYSPSDDKIHISLTHADNEILIAIKDAGIGIPQNMLTKIFSRFYRVEGLSAHMSGLGIGLYLSKEIIERHHGKIWAESELGKGSTFWFSLPDVKSED